MTQDDTIQDGEISDEAMNKALDETVNKLLSFGQEMDATHPSKPDKKQVLEASMDCEMKSIQEDNNEDQ